MDIKPIKTESDYKWALMEIDRLMDAQPDTPEGDRLDIITAIVESYEARHYPIDEPDASAVILYREESIATPVRMYKFSNSVIQYINEKGYAFTDVLVQSYQFLHYSTKFSYTNI